MDLETNISQVISTLKRLLYKCEQFELYDIINNCSFYLNYITSQSDVEFFSLTLECDVDYFYDKDESYNLREAEEHVVGFLSDILRGEPQQITVAYIRPLIKDYINWDIISSTYTKSSLLTDINALKQLILDAATGTRIDAINSNYISLYEKVNIALKKLNIEQPNPYKNLWEAHSYWSSKLPSYAERRSYFSSLYDNLITLITESVEYSTLSLHLEYMGWQDLDRKIAEMKKQFKEAENEEQFNAIGAICRSAYTTLASKVYMPDLHGSVDDVTPSNTDYKRMLEAFINYNLPGSTNAAFRSHCKKTLSLADELTHKTTATKTQTALTITSLISIVNIIKILDDNIIKF